MFTSNLSVSEFVLAEQEAAVPIGQVMGNSAYYLGCQWTGARVVTGEIKELTRPLHDVHLCAIYRMRDAAQKLGAHAVIGVRLEQKRKYPALWTPKNVIEVSATGTAVTLSEDVPEHPILSGLSGQEFHVLRRTGYVPAGLVFGLSVYYQQALGSSVSPTPPGVSALDWGRVNVNVERTDYTQAVAKARHLAMKRMKTEADYRGAEGVVGVSVRTRRALLGDNLIVEFMALGTAIVLRDLPRYTVAHSLSLGE